MVVQVIPIRRLPASISFFDYRVPDSLRNKIKKGQLVNIPFRKSQILGLVFDFAEKERSNNTKEILGIVQESTLLSVRQLYLIKTLSKLYKVSPSVITRMMLPPLQKRKLGKIDITDSPQSTADNLIENKLPTYHLYVDEDEHRTTYSKTVTNKTLIFVPEISKISSAYNLLTKEEQSRTVLWHSELSQKDKFTNWIRIRNNDYSVIIGTRSAVFLPLQEINSIVIDYEHDREHKHWDQAPRFHVHDVVKILSEEYGAKLHFMSYSPSLESYFAIHKGYFDKLQDIKLRNINAQVEDMNAERFGQNYSPLSNRAQNIIRETQGNILLYMNRKGYATSMKCNKCGYTHRCKQCELPMIFYKAGKVSCNYCKTISTLHTSCPSCTFGTMKLHGVGIEKVAHTVRELQNKGDLREVVCVDKDVEIKKSDNPIIFVGTGSALSQIKLDELDAIIIVNIDQQLHIPEYYSAENAWHILSTLSYYKKSNTQLIIQTSSPDHILFRSIYEPDRFYRTDLNLRRSLLYPPYSYLVRYFYGNANPKLAKEHTNKIYQKISQALTKEKKSIKMLHPVEMHPGYYRGKFWYTIVVKSDALLWKSNLNWLNEMIPDAWKVDPHPNGLLNR